MHERSLIQALLAQVACLQAEHEGSTVQEIAVAVGPLSGVEPELLEMAFQELSNDDARLVIERVPLSV
ncbi:MAG TPA: hydrogenase maturation nickel metallochaperone HypA, partial [Gemmatales bacterium]|nr:hydrogenase maturation nickel metallochaperone HypA [Gemmatales bacterium]